MKSKILCLAVVAAMLGAPLFFTAQANAQVSFSLGPTWNVNIPVPDYINFPDGHITLLPDGDTNQMYWAELDSYRTFGSSVDNQSSANPNNALLAEGASGQPDHNGCWIMNVFRQSGNNLIAFYHMEDHVFSGVDQTPIAWIAVGVATSTDDGQSWTKKGMILGKPSYKPSTATWGGIGNQCTVWDSANSRFMTFFPCVDHTGRSTKGISAAISTTGLPGTWTQYYNGSFSESGIDGDDTALPGLSDATGGNPSVTWNTYLNKWLMVWHDYPNSTLYISSSSDLMNWSSPQTLINGTGVGGTGYEVSNPTIIGSTDLVCGQTANLYYSAWPNGNRKFFGQSISFSGGGTGSTAGGTGGATIANGTYQIVNRNSGLALDDPNGASGSIIDQQPYGGANQQWTVTASGSYYTITNSAGLALSGGSGHVQLAAAGATGGDDQLWSFTANGSYYLIKNKQTGLVLDVFGGSTSAGDTVGTWDINSGTNQDWSLTTVTGGGTGGGTTGATRFNHGQYLAVNQYITSPSKNCFLIQQSDGNLVLYKGSGPGDNHGGLWASLTAAQPNGSYFTILQDDGNLVTYKGTGPADNHGGVWANFTSGSNYLQITDSQKLQIISGTTVQWQKP